MRDQARALAPSTGNVIRLADPAKVAEVTDDIGRGQESQELIIFPRSLQYVELAHCKHARIVNPENGKIYRLTGFPGAPPGYWQTVELGKKIANVVNQNNWSFDTICTMSTMALPMAYSYMFVKRNPRYLVAFDNITGNFLPEDFLIAERGRSVLLVDTLVQTGNHLELAWNKIASQHHVVGFIAAIENDLLPRGEEKCDFLKRKMQDGYAQSLWKASELVKNMEEARASVAAGPLEHSE